MFVASRCVVGMRNPIYPIFSENVKKTRVCVTRGRAFPLLRLTLPVLQLYQCVALDTSHVPGGRACGQ
eukprot:1011931-Prymnesium_polylepis.1